MLFFAALEFGDFLIIGMAILLLVVVLAGALLGGAARGPGPADRARWQRIEHKLDLILNELGIKYVPPAKTVWQEIADDPSRKIAAIKAYREEFGVGLAEAKKAVEDYLENRSP
jgi:hypothetical protein